MKQQKSHARIHQVILQLRQKSKQQETFDIETTLSKQIKKGQFSIPGTMAHSQFLSQSETSSLILPKSSNQKFEEKNFYKISNIIGSQSLNSQKADDLSGKRQIKTARPVSSRRKVASKDKYSKTVNQKDELFKIEAKKSQLFEPLQILEPEYFVLQKGQDEVNMKQGEIKNLKAFWAKSHTLVSLFPLEYTECVIYNHPNIIPVYGEVKLKNIRYVVSNQYKHCSLRDLIKQFGAFGEKLCKIYLYQVLFGLEEMHNRKIAHNRLSTESILYDKEGQIFINVVKSTSRPLSQKQKHDKLFQFSPQMLLTKGKSNSLRSDIWSIGIILLDMLFNFEQSDPKFMKFHPYNFRDQKLSQTDSIIVDNLKQLYVKSFHDSKNEVIDTKIQAKFDSLSRQCKDVIYKCLRMNKDQRVSLKGLKQHPFFYK